MDYINTLSSKAKFINFSIFWLIYILVYLLLKSQANAYTWLIIMFNQLSMDTFGIYMSFRLYRTSYGVSRTVFFWWMLAFIAGFIADAFFNAIVNMFSINTNSSLLVESLIAIPFFIFIIFQTIGWIKILTPIINIKNNGKRSYLYVPIILMGIIILTIYISAYSSKIYPFSWAVFYKIISTILEVTSFVIVSICFAAAKIPHIRYLATGYLVILVCDMVLKINFIYHSMGPNNFADISWGFGLMVLSIGLFKFHTTPVSFTKWAVRANNIQLQFTFWIFTLCFLFLLIFITLDYFMFSSATFFYNEHLKVLACVLIFLSILILWVSYIFTRTLLGPLHKMRGAIKKFVSTNKAEIKLLESDYNIIEFNQLNSFIRNSFQIILDRQKVENALIDNAAQVVHDIGSPLTTMEVAIKKLESLKVDHDSIDLLKSSVLSVRNIASNLLNRYKDPSSVLLKNDVIEPRYVILNSFIDQLISNKRIEWNDAGCNLSFESNLTHQVYWAFISPSQLARKLSNLLNNAHESLDKIEKKIVLYLSVVGDNFEIVIEDNGCGIPTDKINDVLTGKSLKRGGNGIGLSRAVDYFKNLHGSLSLESAVNVGTKVFVTFPVSAVPIWYPEVIKYHSNTVFVILDDDISIHNLWQKMLSNLKIVSKHFVNSKDFMDWYSSAVNKSSIFFFIDYELYQDEHTGLEIIEKLNLTTNTYLVTGNAESFRVQDAILGSKIKLIPKSLLGYITLQKY